LSAKRIKQVQVIAPSLGRRFSGINASMLAVLPQQTQRIDIAAMGFHIDGKDVPKIHFRDFFRHGRSGSWRIWHARRNIDMLAGLILKFIFRFKLLLVFTSAAQRKHSAITHFYCRHMEKIITPTSAAATYLKQPAHVVPHGVDTARFFPPKNRDAEWMKRSLPGTFGIGILGRIRPDKGTLEFVEAAIAALQSRPDWTAVIIGLTTPEHLPFEQKLRSLVKEDGLERRIIFIGFEKDTRAIPAWLRALSITVCASHTEGFGLPCLEAMACACPVVATQTGAWPEIIEPGENGLLIPTKDTHALTQTLEMLMDSPKTRQSMGRKARTTILNNYQIANEADGIQAVYEQLLNQYQAI
jgi:glycosyltransferase involved in cell wall biosynthesis